MNGMNLNNHTCQSKVELFSLLMLLVTAECISDVLCPTAVSRFKVGRGEEESGLPLSRVMKCWRPGTMRSHGLRREKRDNRHKACQEKNSGFLNWFFKSLHRQVNQTHVKSMKYSPHYSGR